VERTFSRVRQPKTVTDPSVHSDRARNGDSTAGITIEEVEAAILRLKKHKAPGTDNIMAGEIQAAGNTEMLEKRKISAVVDKISGSSDTQGDG